MTAQASTTTDRPAGRSVFARIGASLVSMIEMLSSASRLGRAAEEARWLLSLSDEDLARRGLRRDEVMRHVFGPYLHL